MSRPRWMAALALVAVPAAIAAAHAWTARAVSPLWMGGSTDPTYPYVLNALLVAEGQPPALATHPGTPLQVLGAVVLRVSHGLSGVSLSLRDHVLTDPERFVAAIRAVLLCLFVLADVLQGWAAYRLTRSLACATAVQAAPLVSTLGSRTMLAVMCEPLLLVFGLLLSAWTLVVMSRDTKAPTARDAVLAGIVMGVGLATKILFVPLALLPLVVIRDARRRAAFLATTAIAFASGIAPLWPHVPSAAAWVASSLRHTGLDTGGYGLGPGGFVDVGLFADVLFHFLSGDVVVYVLAAIALAAIVVLRKRTPPAAFPLRRALLAALAVQVLVLLQSAKSMGPHHLMTAVSVTGLVVALTLALARSALTPGSRIPAVAAVLLAFFLVGRHALFLRAYLEARAPVRPGARAAAALARSFGMERVLQGYCVSTIASNVAMAHDWTWRAFGADLRRLYPRAVFFDWAGLHRFGQPVTVPEMEMRLVDGEALVVWDTLLYPNEVFGFFRGLRMTELGRWGRDRVLRGSLAPLPAGTPSDAGPRFAGLLILGPSVGADRPAPGRMPEDLVPLGPTTRLAILGTGRPQRLLAESRCDEPPGQVLTFTVDGEVVGRQPLASPEGWRRSEIALPPRRGLFELAIRYERLWTSENSARPMYPGYGARDPEVRWPAVRYRTLQVSDSGSTSGAAPAASPRTDGGSSAGLARSRGARSAPSPPGSRRSRIASGAPAAAPPSRTARSSRP